MALSTDNETETLQVGQNIPILGKNDSVVDGSARVGGDDDWTPELIRDQGNEIRLFSNLPINGIVPDLSEVAVEEAAETARLTTDKLADDVWSAVQNFRSSGSQDWVVRIRPDQETELNLRFRLQDGQLMVHARLENGSWDVVAPHWGDLQALLADRGVQLRPLENGAGQHGQNSGGGQNWPANDSGQFGSSNQSPHNFRNEAARNLEWSELGAERARRSSEAGKPAPAETPRRSQRWETWA